MGRECQQYLPITTCSLGYRSGYSGSATVPSSRSAASATFALNSALCFFRVFDKSHLQPNRRPKGRLSLSNLSSFRGPPHIFHTAPVRACRYPPEDESDDGEMDHRLNLLLVLSSLFRLSCRGFIVIRPLTPNPITAIATGTPSDSQSGSRGRSACEIIIARRTPAR